VLGISSGHQAVISAAGEAQSIGNLSLYTIERELKQAGFGISSPDLLGCQFNAYRTTLISRKLYPVDIQPLANGSDSLTIAYGSSDMRMGPIPLATAYPAMIPTLPFQTVTDLLQAIISFWGNRQRMCIWPNQFYSKPPARQPFPISAALLFPTINPAD